MVCCHYFVQSARLGFASLSKHKFVSSGVKGGQSCWTNREPAEVTCHCSVQPSGPGTGRRRRIAKRWMIDQNGGGVQTPTRSHVYATGTLQTQDRTMQDGKTTNLIGAEFDGLENAKPEKPTEEISQTFIFVISRL